MFKKLKSVLFLVMVFASLGFTIKNNTLINRAFKVAEEQYTLMLKVATDLKKYPRGGGEQGQLKYVSINDWTGGFWPGSLWFVYEYTKDEKWKIEAEKWTHSLEQNQFNTNHHDIGFMMFCSYGNGYRLTKNKTYPEILVQSAKSLITRYSPVVKSIKSWNERKNLKGEVQQYPVIMDNMMNLELLFFASKHTKDPIFREIAIKHAETTMQNHIREDYSSFHMVNYSPETGKVLHKEAVQGFANNSTWARGQAWGIYGFTMVYRETKDLRFLNTAQKMADFFLEHKNLPQDQVPFWDFNVAQKGFNPDWNFDQSQKYLFRDASAAAITASALIELSTFSNKESKNKYYKAALEILKTLSNKEYLAKAGDNNNFILKHSVGHLPKKSEIDVPLVYADYYYLEALLRLQKLSNNQPLGLL